MSGEGVAVVAVGAAVGSVVLLGGAAGASCAFVVGHSLEALGSYLERGQARKEGAHAVIMQWQEVVRDVALRNGRIGVLRSSAERAAADSLPQPLTLGTQTLAELRAWCAETDQLLHEADQRVAGQEAQSIMRRIAVLAELPELRTGFDLPGGQPDAVSRAAASGRGRQASLPGQPAGRALAVDVERVTRRVRAGVTGTEQEAIARAAERVLRAGTRIEALNRLGDLRERVKQANHTTERRYAEAAEAAQLLQPLLHAGDAAESLRADLLEVAAGNAALSDGLRERARQAATKLQEANDQRYIKKSVLESLAELGYVADEGFQTMVPRDGMLQLTRSEWNAHGVRMVLDGDQHKLVTALVRTKAEDRWDSSALDTERENAWCTDQDKLKELLAAKSITLEVRSLTPPGQRHVPLVEAGPARPDTSAAPSAAPRTGRA